MSVLNRGTFYLSLGWSVQLIAGYLMKIWLTRELGPSEYGNYGVVMSILLWIEMGAINGLSTATQKFIADSPDNARGILWSIAKIQMIVNSILFLPCFFCASHIANLLKAPELGVLIQIAIWDIWVYSLYFMFFSLMNGLQRFDRQAGILIFYATTKVVFVVFLVRVTHSISGALIGNIIASIGGLLFGLLLSRKVLSHSDHKKQETRPLIRFALPVAINVLTMQLLFSVDLWFIMFHWGSESAGYYIAASDIARIPYYLFLALSSVVMPVLSSALTNNNKQLIKDTVRQAIWMISIIIIPIAALAFIYSKEIIILIFKYEFIDSADVLNILIWGISLFAFYYLLTTMINADNKPHFSLVMTILILFVNVILNAWLVPAMGIRGGALATSISLLVGSIGMSYIVYKRFKILMTGLSMIRILAAASVMIVIGCFLPVNGIMLFPTGVVLFCIYILILVGLREITLNDILKYMKM